MGVTDSERTTVSGSAVADAVSSSPSYPPLLRSGIAGILMGLANLVPGVSGGTMIVVMGLYDDFIEAIAGVTRLKLSRRNLVFLTVVGLTAVCAIAALAGTLGRAVALHRSAMFSLFIGMTLGGAPLLVKMIGTFKRRTVAGVIIGLVIMLVIALGRTTPHVAGDGPEAKAQGAALVVEPAYVRDVLAGVLGMSAMVLPGISGAYMLLILGRYQTILSAISIFKTAVLDGGSHPQLSSALHVLVPTAVGALFSIVFFSNVLKWMLQHRRNVTLGMLLGILFGSVVGIWPFDSQSVGSDYLLGTLLAVAGFVFTTLLSRIRV